MKLSTHFSLSEFTKSYTAQRLGIDNSIPKDVQDSVIENLTELCANVLEPIRKKFKKPVSVNSGYRSPKLNKAVKGSKNSQHCFGQAADIEIAGISNAELGSFIENNLEFDQLIYENISKTDPSAGWIHVSFKHGNNRNQVLQIFTKK